MTSTPEDIIRDALRHDPRRSSSEEGSREALAALDALDALVGVRDELSKRLLNAQAETLRLHRIEEAATRVLNEMGGRRSATPMLAAIAELRAALKEQG